MMQQVSKTRQTGFSLLELILVLGVASMIATKAFEKMKMDIYQSQAKTAGEQIAVVGRAANNYVMLRSNAIQNLVNAKGGMADPGPRTCDIKTETCRFTITTLINEGFLPVGFQDINAFNASYDIMVKRRKSGDGFAIDGAVVTSLPYTIDSVVRYDLLGTAVRNAGSDGGMTGGPGDNHLQLNGEHGGWFLSGNAFPIINQLGQLGYRIGSSTSIYSAFLPRDGSKPMLGALQMNGQAIEHVKDIQTDTVQAGHIKAKHIKGDTMESNFSEVQDALVVQGGIGVAGSIGVGGGAYIANEVWSEKYSNLKAFRNIRKIQCTAGDNTGCGAIKEDDHCQKINEVPSNGGVIQTWLCS